MPILYSHKEKTWVTHTQSWGGKCTLISVRLLHCLSTKGFTEWAHEELPRQHHPASSHGELSLQQQFRKVGTREQRVPTVTLIVGGAKPFISCTFSSLGYLPLILPAHGLNLCWRIQTFQLLLYLIFTPYSVMHTRFATPSCWIF